MESKPAQLTKASTEASRYHYIECGLPNVWLANGFKRVKTKYGEGIAIDSVQNLHRVIADILVFKKPKLTGREFRFLRKELELSQRIAGVLVGATDQTVSLWERETQELPDHADRSIRYVYMNERDPKSKIREVVKKLQEIDTQERKLLIAQKSGKWLAKAANF